MCEKGTDEACWVTIGMDSVDNLLVVIHTYGHESEGNVKVRRAHSHFYGRHGLAKI